MSKYCAKCGKELPEGVEVCPGCGTAANGNSEKKYTAPTSWSWIYRIGFTRRAVEVSITDDHLEMVGEEPLQVPFTSIRRVEPSEHKATLLWVQVIMYFVLGILVVWKVSLGMGLIFLGICSLYAYKSSFNLHHFELKIVCEWNGQEQEFYLIEKENENLAQIKAALDQHMV